MKTQYYNFHLSLIIFLLTLAGCAESTSSDKLTIGNNLYTKTFHYQTSSPGAIEVAHLDKITNLSLNDKSEPFFEFVIGGIKTTASDKLWIFTGEAQRSLMNGGTEYRIVFKGAKGPVDGLQVIIYQQTFPNSTLIREKLELRVEGDKQFTLNKINDKLHFEFPKYRLTSADPSPVSTEIRIASWELRPITFSSPNPSRNQNHMYYPNILTEDLVDELNVKGPINILTEGKFSWISAYEHASQDDLSGMLNESKISQDGKIVDAMQGTKGIFNFPIRDEDFRFIEIRQQREGNTITLSNAVVRGAYLEGEIIDKGHPYATVWNATAFHEGRNIETSKSIIRNYLFNEICEKPASRQPEFYYNTWGLQRADRSKPLRGILTYERIFEEIDRAAELGVDLFVLDDGWEQTQGDWTPNKERLPQGLAPIKEKLDRQGIKMGVWLSPMGIDSTTERYKQHPEWVIRDSEGNPILAQWGHPAFDFVGPFFDVFIEDCKKLIDQGARFFKWDAINTFYSSLPDLDHGSGDHSEMERRARYEYLLPIYVTKAMEILTDYEPELIIEMDVTEARRVMMGLAPLSQGKIFHMNNGASWYNDYTEFRTNSMRTIPNEYNGIIPLELFTYANYPHNLANSMHYNVNTSLIAGHGFWGDLSLTTKEERLEIGYKVAKSKSVLPLIKEVNTDIVGQVGDAPEIYTQINHNAGAGQIIAFSSKALKYTHTANLPEAKPLAVLNHPYAINDNSLSVNFHFPGPSTTLEAFLIPSKEIGISILSSSCVIDQAAWQNEQLIYHANDRGSQVIFWDKTNGKPMVLDRMGVKHQIEEKKDHFLISIELQSKGKIVIGKSSS